MRERETTAEKQVSAFDSSYVNGSTSLLNLVLYLPCIIWILNLLEKSIFSGICFIKLLCASMLFVFRWCVTVRMQCKYVKWINAVSIVSNRYKKKRDHTRPNAHDFVRKVIVYASSIPKSTRHFNLRKNWLKKIEKICWKLKI